MEFQRKQINDWNKWKKKKMDVLTSLEWKTKSASQKDLEESSILDAKWMIRWMQEMDSIFQEFAQKNNMRILNLPLNKYGPMQSHLRSKDQKSDEGEESDDEEYKQGEDKME